MLKLLITGANGFAGFYIVRLLLEQNHFTVATGKGSCRLPFDQTNFSWESLDFTNDEEVENIFQKHKPQIVIHSGAMSKPDECELNREAAFRTNVTGTMRLLHHSSLQKCFFIFLSTDFVFDGERGMYSEEDPTGPVNYYGETKLLAEEEVKKYEHDWAIVRTVLVYGKPFQSRQNILTSTAIALKKGERLQIFDDQVRTPTYVEDLARGILAVVSKRAKGIFHISGEDVLTPHQMAMDVAHHLSLDSNLISNVSLNEFKQPAKRPLKTGFNISKAKSLLDYQPLSFKEGLKKTFE